jgi:glycosyltransferase involved in cell wall biosynthesis
MSERARVLLHVFSTLEIGGPQLRFVQLANHFGRKYRHAVIAMDGATEALARIAGDVDIRLIEVPARRGRAVAAANAREFRSVLRAIEPDLLVTLNWGTIEWALANLDRRYPHLHLEDGFGPEEALRQIPRRVWTRRLLLRRTQVLLPSQTLYRVARDTWRLSTAQLLYVPNGIDCDRFGAGPDPVLAARMGIGPGPPVIGTVAGLRKEKNLERLLEAFAMVVRSRAARLVIVGDGPERSSLVVRAAELGIGDKVVMTGAYAFPERLLPSFDMFALSSDTEQMPLSVLEAMAAGLPLAATDVGDLRAMLDEQNHPFLVGTDARQLADAITGLLVEPKCAAVVGAANARRARALFDQRLMFAAYRRLFDGEFDRVGQRLV